MLKHFAEISPYFMIQFIIFSDGLLEYFCGNWPRWVRALFIN